MSASQDPASEPGGDVRLQVAHAARIDIDAARVAFSDLTWLGQSVEGSAQGEGVRRVAADLELPVLDGSAPRPVRKSSLIDLGPTRVADGGLSLSVSWQSATLAPLFPVFSGELRVAPDGLSLAGRYMPPLGRVGLVIDAALLHFVARRTAQAFLSRIAARISS